MKEEISNLFHLKTRKQEKPAVWQHRFVCLAYQEQDRVPTTDVEKEELYLAGLGEKTVEFESLQLTKEQFKAVIYKAFPPLEISGGFQFLKCVPNTRKLELLSVIVHSSVSHLKLCVGYARTYIRPVQRDLDLTPVVDTVEGVSNRIMCCRW